MPAPVSFVLKALRILSLDEMKRLSEILKVRVSAPKKAAGGELIVWDDEEEVSEHQPAPEKNATIIPFPKKTINEIEPLEIKNQDAVSDDQSSFVHTDLMLWQREISRHSDENVHRNEAFKGYKKSTEMYIVKESTIDGKDKIRFASTNGVLVNKKQA